MKCRIRLKNKSPQWKIRVHINIFLQTLCLEKETIFKITHLKLFAVLQQTPF